MAGPVDILFATTTITDSYNHIESRLERLKHFSLLLLF